MLVACTVRRALAASAALALFGGCSALHFAPPAPSVGGAPYAAGAGRAARGAGRVFVSDVINGAVWICPTNSDKIEDGFLPPTAQLKGVFYPVQIAVDRAGTVYVANSENASGAGSVTIYPRGQLTPSRTLTSGLFTTTGVAVDSSGTVYASNKLLGSIEIFPKGTSVPSATITANLIGPDGLAVDKAGDLYIADGSAHSVLKVVRGSETPQPLHLQGLLEPTGVAVDSHGNLYVSNLLGASSNVAVYPPGAIKPSRTFTVPGPKNGQIGEPVMLSLAPGDLLIVSSFISINTGSVYDQVSAADGFAYGQSQPLWIEYNQQFGSTYINYYDAVFQPAH